MDETRADAAIPHKPALLPTTEELIARIGWLIRLRWVAVLSIPIFIEVGRRILPIKFYVQPLYIVVGSLAVYNLVVSLLLPRVHRVREPAGHASAAKPAREPFGPVARFLLPRGPYGLEYDRLAGRAALFANVQITIDLIILAVLLHFAGGIENPLRVFFVFHVIIASILLSRPATYLNATLGLLFLAAVVLGELWGLLPHYSLEGHWRSNGYLNPHLVATQLFLLGVTLYVTAYMGTAIAVRLRERELEVVVLSRALAEKAEHLETAYAEVSAAEKAKSQYMRKVAHELRGPLGTIKTALGVVLDLVPGNAAPGTEDLIRRAHRRAGELAVVTADLLSLARARGNKAIARHALASPPVIAAQVLEEMRARAAERGVALTVSIGEPLHDMMADAEGLADLMGNLLSNAIRYTPERGTVAFRLHEAEGRLVIEVKDTGIGIPTDDLERIYDEFYRAKAAREFTPDGSGLGMAIIKAVVDQHDGSIVLESAPGVGTLVRVELPMRRES